MPSLTVVPPKGGIQRLFYIAKIAAIAGFALRQKLTTLDSAFRRNDGMGAKGGGGGGAEFSGFLISRP